MAVSQSPSVWIVTDNEDDRYLFELALKTLTPPVAVKLLNSGEELLTALSTPAPLPNLIILDVIVPRLNGLATLTHLRAEPAYQHLPILVSTLSEPEDQEKALKLGANGFLTEKGATGDLLMLYNKLVNHWIISL